jgi:hypothetical protein
MALKSLFRAGTITLSVATLVLVAGLLSAERVEATDQSTAPNAGVNGPGGTIEVADARASREVFDALKTLRNAVQKHDRIESENGRRAAALPRRPERKVVAPSFDSATLDSMIDQSLAAAKTEAARRTTDEEFVRRVFLDVTGELPTPEQIVSFCRNRDREKRGKLIDYLLASREYAENWARYWRDVIEYHSVNVNRNKVRSDVFVSWLADEFAKNAPWDEIATKMIVAEGPNDKNGAVNFAIAQQDGSPVEMAGEVSRIFMGVQIQCAQCHDHPTDSWKRKQFHEFAAFFAGNRVRREVKGEDGKVLNAQQAKKALQTKTKGQPQPKPYFVLFSQPRPKYTMPDLKDPQKQIPVVPKFFLASSTDTIPDGLSATELRKLAASYITGQDNPWFARAYVNRIWYVLMGDSFYNPVDDLGPDRTANLPEIIDTLADAWAKGGYDIRWLFRVILNSKAYQREIRSVNTKTGRTPFAANCASRLRADQIYDALAHALDLPIDGAGGGGMMKGIAKKPGAQAKRGPLTPRDALNKLFGADPSLPNDDVLGTIPQALFLMNSPQVNKAIEARPGTMLGQLLMSTPDNRAVLEALYLRVLARRPTTSEVESCGRYLSAIGDRRTGFEDILWALVNSTEFLSRR